MEYVQKPLLFIDMDNVLVDFKSGLAKVPEEIKHQYEQDERGNNHNAVLAYNKRVFDLVYDAQAHRNESYEASEYFNVLSNEYQKITRAIYQSGHVETMADLKRELGF